MQNSLPSGIRSISDALDDDIAGSVKLMDEFCKREGSRFFFDTSDCDIYDVGGKRLNDLYGWIVPESEADAFERKWMAWDDRNDDDFGNQWHHAIVWTDHAGVATPVVLTDAFTEQS